MGNKHYGSYQGNRYIILGYNNTRGKFLVLDPMRLTGEDQKWIGELIDGDYAQDRLNLRDALIREYHVSGQDGWTWAVSRGVEIPAHEVLLADRDQADQWIGSPTNYSPKLEESIKREHQQVNQPIAQPAFPETPRQMLGVKEPDVMSTLIRDLNTVIMSLSDEVSNLKEQIASITAAPAPAKRQRPSRAKKSA